MGNCKAEEGKANPDFKAWKMTFEKQAWESERPQPMEERNAQVL